MRHRLEYLIVRALVAIVRVTPGVIVRGAGTVLGLAFYTIDRAHWRIAERNLATAFPAVRQPNAAPSRARTAHFGACCSSCCNSRRCRLNGCSRVEFDGESDRARLRARQGRAVHLGHFGFWELQAMVRGEGRAGHHPRARARQPASQSLLEQIR
jgi:lauroyl/myristoyl acyltransferase